VVTGHPEDQIRLRDRVLVERAGPVAGDVEAALAHHEYRVHRCRCFPSHGSGRHDLGVHSELVEVRAQDRRGHR
jgi:hypothetical protein